MLSKILTIGQYVASVIKDYDNPLAGILTPAGAFLDEIEEVWSQRVAGVKVYVGSSPFVMSQFGAAVAASVPTAVDGSEAVVITDALWDKLTPQSQACCLWHEFGHIANGDMVKLIEFSAASADIGRKPSPREVRDFLSIESEFAADEYAAEHCGYSATIMQLCELRMVAGPLLGTYGNEEITARIKNLANKMHAKKGVSEHAA